MLRSAAVPSFITRLRQRIAETLSRLHLRCSRCCRQNHKLTHVNQVEETIMPIMPIETNENTHLNHTKIVNVKFKDAFTQTDESNGEKTHLNQTNILPVKVQDAFTQTDNLETETNIYHTIEPPTIESLECYDEYDHILKA